VWWTIPDDIFTNSAVFTVHDADVPSHFVNTSNIKISIDPPFKLTKGPGTTRDGDGIYVNTNVKCTIQTDTALLTAQPSGWEVTISKDRLNFTNATIASVVSVVLVDISNVTVTWTATTPMTDVYYRIRTTSLVPKGYPYELSTISKDFIEILDEISCDGIIPSPPTEFVLCDLSVRETDTGRTNNFERSAIVTLTFAYLNTFSGTSTWTYRVNNGTNVNWPVTGPDTSRSGFVSYQAVIPNVATDNFVVTVNSGTQTKSTPPLTVEPTIQFQVIPYNVPIYETSSYGGFTMEFYMIPVEGGIPPASWTVAFTKADGTTTYATIRYEQEAYCICRMFWQFLWRDLGFTQTGQNLVGTMTYTATFTNNYQQTTTVPHVTLTAAVRPPIIGSPISYVDPNSGKTRYLSTIQSGFDSFAAFIDVQGPAQHWILNADKQICMVESGNECLDYVDRPPVANSYVIVSGSPFGIAQFSVTGIGSVNIRSSNGICVGARAMPPPNAQFKAMYLTNTNPCPEFTWEKLV
jgi:hypothetical protein